MKGTCFLALMSRRSRRALRSCCRVDPWNSWRFYRPRISQERLLRFGLRARILQQKFDQRLLFEGFAYLDSLIHSEKGDIVQHEGGLVLSQCKTDEVEHVLKLFPGFF